MPSDICRSAYRSLAPAAAADIQPELLVLCGVHGLNLFVFCSDRLQARNFKLESEGETAASVLRPKKRKAEGLCIILAYRFPHHKCKILDKNKYKAMIRKPLKNSLFTSVWYKKRVQDGDREVDQGGKLRKAFLSMSIIIILQQLWSAVLLSVY
ncbi:hypothetical protein NDU88_006829 [Pleurodeles waltl]|uniref:Uncharacterized protein n=1 Tax=Pleurodeles waltl TaxID=8319 RepID=A0AAV7MNF8_PLEWA|nr:hypothetical protein NDU88_006829 [Pleurodeles waltl]